MYPFTESILKLRVEIEPLLGTFGWWVQNARGGLAVNPLIKHERVNISIFYMTLEMTAALYIQYR